MFSFGFLVSELDTWDDVVVLLLWFVDSDIIWHNLGDLSYLSFDGHHDFDLESEDTLSHVDVSNSDINEISLWLSSGDLITG